MSKTVYLFWRVADLQNPHLVGVFSSEDTARACAAARGVEYKKASSNPCAEWPGMHFVEECHMDVDLIAERDLKMAQQGARAREKKERAEYERLRAKFEGTT